MKEDEKNNEINEFPLLQMRTKNKVVKFFSNIKEKIELTKRKIKQNNSQDQDKYLDCFDEEKYNLGEEEDEENDFSLTYKKRYPVSEGDLMSAVHLAESEGFNLSENKWEPEVDWGYTGMKLSLSAEVSIPADTEETIADLDPSEGFSMMMENMPEEEKNWKADLWGINTFQRAELAGPIFFTRYTGEFLSQKTRIEIWEIHDERDDSVHYLTELSFKTDHYEKATAIRKQMM